MDVQLAALTPAPLSPTPPNHHGQVLDKEICFHQNQYLDLFEMFHSRQIMHRKVYTHRCGCGAGGSGFEGFGLTEH